MREIELELSSWLRGVAFLGLTVLSPLVFMAWRHRMLPARFSKSN